MPECAPHPADLLMARIHHETRMEHIRNMDIDAWVREQITTDD